MSEQNYKELLNEFLKLEVNWDLWGMNPQDWVDYVAKYNLDEGHIPDLIRMLETYSDPTNNFEDAESYAAVHAWRALGQLKAGAAIPALIDLIQQNKWEDWSAEELPHIFGMIGAAAIEPLVQALEPIREFFPGEVFASSLQQIATTHPSERDRVVGILSDKIKQSEQNDSDLNAFIVGDLVELKAVEAIDIIRECYENGHADESILGTVQEVEVRLGLRAPEDVTDSFAIRNQKYREEQAKLAEREQLIRQNGWFGLTNEEIEQRIQRENERREKQKRKRVQAHKNKWQNRKKSKKKRKK